VGEPVPVPRQVATEFLGGLAPEQEAVPACPLQLELSPQFLVEHLNLAPADELSSRAVRTVHLWSVLADLVEVLGVRVGDSRISFTVTSLKMTSPASARVRTSLSLSSRRLMTRLIPVLVPRVLASHASPTTMSARKLEWLMHRWQRGVLKVRSNATWYPKSSRRLVDVSLPSSVQMRSFPIGPPPR
jgi:hypothetical protein